MAGASLVQVLGTTRNYKVTAMKGRVPLTNTFTGSDALSGAVWPGGTLAAVVTPQLSWIDATAGTIQMTIPASALTNVAAGLYQVRIFVTPTADGQPRDVLYDMIRFLPIDGTGTVPTSFITYDDMVAYSSEVAKLQGSDTDLLAFAGQRNRAMSEFVETVVRRYVPRAGGSRRYLSADGTAPGPYLMLGGSPDGSLPPSRSQLRGWLTPTRLILNEDVIEANARMAAALVYGSTPGQGNIYSQMADKEWALARLAADRAVIEIDTAASPTGSPTIRVDRDIVYLT